MILLDSSYNSRENDVLFLKIEGKVLIQWLDKSIAKDFGPELP